MSNNNQPNGENNEAQKAKRDSRTGIANANVTSNSNPTSINPQTTSTNKNVVTNQGRGVVTSSVPVTEGEGDGNGEKKEVVNPYVKNNSNQGVRTASVFTKKNKVANNPFADGDGGGDINTNSGNTDGKVKLNKTDLDPHTRFLLRHYLDLANPVYAQEEQTITLTRRGGEQEEVKRKRPVFKGYEFYMVDGKPFEDWLVANCGEGCKVDPITKEIYKEGTAVVNQTDTQVKK